MHVYMHVYIYKYKHICIRTHTHTHTHHPHPHLHTHSGSTLVTSAKTHSGTSKAADSERGGVSRSGEEECFSVCADAARKWLSSR